MMECGACGTVLHHIDEQYAEAARRIHLYLAEFCDETLPYNEMIADAGVRAAHEIARLRCNPMGAMTGFTHLVCPDSENRDYMLASDEVNFWIDADDVWHIDCLVCGGEHCLGDVMGEWE